MQIKVPHPLYLQGLWHFFNLSTVKDEIIHEFLENKVSTLFIQHHVLENMVSLYLHELSEKEEILDGYEVYTQLFCV